MNPATVQAIAESVTAASVVAGAATWIARQISSSIRQAAFKASQIPLNEARQNLNNISLDMQTKLMKSADQADTARTVTAAIAAAVLLLWILDRFDKKK